MTTPRIAFSGDWKQLYLRVMSETDPSRLPTLIKQANDTICDRIEQADATMLQDEMVLLNDALNGLRLLRREYERNLQEYGEIRSKAG